MPVAPTYPGVYVQELPSGFRTIVGVATSIAAFVDWFPRGPMDTAVQVFSWADFARIFGGLHDRSEASYGIQQFFLNGGATAWIVRVAAHTTADPLRTAAVVLNSDNGSASLEVRAASPGKWGNGLRVRVRPNDTANFDLAVRELSIQNGREVISAEEDYLNLSSDPSSRFVNTLVNAAGGMITVVDKTGKARPTPTGTVGKPAADAFTATTSVLRGSGDKPVTVELRLQGTGTVTETRSLKLGSTKVESLEDAAARLEGALRASLPGSEPGSVAGRAEFAQATAVVVGDQLQVTAGSGETCAATLTFVTGAVAAKLGLQSDAATATAASNAAAALATATGNVATAEAAVATAQAAVAAATTAAATAAANTALTTANTNLGTATTNLATATTAALALAGPATVNVASYQVGATTAVLAQALATASGFGEGADGALPGSQELCGSAATAPATGLQALDLADLFNLLCLPRVAKVSGSSSTADDFPQAQVDQVVSLATRYCESRRAVLLLDPPSDLRTLPAIRTWMTEKATLRHQNVALHFPRVIIADPMNDFRDRAIGASGTVAGLCARNDTNRGVWSAPAGTEAVLRGVSRLDYKLTDAENGQLNPIGINCLRTFDLYGNVNWGARTLHGEDSRASEWKYLQIRRMALYLEETLFRSTQWVIFADNDEPLWNQIRVSVGAFMADLFQKGAFQGKTKQDAYFVHCDASTTKPLDQERGIVNLVVGFAPLKPAEFLVISIQQIAPKVEV